MDPENSPPPRAGSFSLREVLLATAIVAVSLGWIVDRIAISVRNQALQDRIRIAEEVEDQLENRYMDNAIIGRPVTDFPDLFLLADDIIEHTDKRFDGALRWASSNPEIVSSDRSRIVYFELETGVLGSEGVPSEFALLVEDDIIVNLRRGETLQL